MPPEASADECPPAPQSRPAATAPGCELDDAVDQRHREHAHGDTVGEALGAGEQDVHFISAQVNLEATGLDRRGDAIEARRQIDGQLGETDS